MDHIISPLYRTQPVPAVNTMNKPLFAVICMICMVGGILLAFVTDLTAAGDSGGQIVDRILEIAQPLVGSGRFFVSVVGNLHVEGPVRAVGVVVVDKVVEPGLLLQEVLGGGAGGLVLQGQAHAFVAAILFRGGRGLMRSILIPSLSHHTDSLLSPQRALQQEKGTRLSVRIVRGSPKSLKALSKTLKAADLLSGR